MKHRLALTFLPVAALLAGCYPQDPNRTALAGDSISVQAWNYGDMDGIDASGKIGLGWEEEHAIRRVRADVNNPATSPGVLVIEFGHNTVRPQSEGGDNFTRRDRNQLLALATTPDPSALVVFVKPSYYGPNLHHWLGIYSYRANIDRLVAAGPGLGRRWCSADWAQVTDPVPSRWISGDGVHLREPAAGGRAAARFVQFIVDGVRTCQ